MAVSLCRKAGKLASSGELDAALSHVAGAIRLSPRRADFHAFQGSLFTSAGRPHDSIEAYRQALSIRPDFAPVHVNLSEALLRTGRLEEAETACRRGLETCPDLIELYSTLLVLLLGQPHRNPEEIAAEHLQWGERFAPPRQNPVPHANDPDPGRRLRLGYVSADYCFHPASFFVHHLFENHDRRLFEVFCYGNMPRHDEHTERVKKAADHWRDIQSLNHRDVAARIREDRIDILVDLNGHFAWNRLPVFAFEPAPVQVTMISYPATTGVRAIRYRISDPFIDPPGQTEHLYHERVLRLPHSFLCYEPPADAPPLAPLPFLRTGQFTFAVFNNRTKITRQALDLWASILDQVPGSRLHIHDVFSTGVTAEPHPRDPIRSTLRKLGVPPERVRFTGALPLHDYLNLYADVDLGLDTFPRSGMTTTMESLWMGVPAVTMAGKYHAARVGVTILRNLGLGGDLVAASPEQYVALAVRAAKSPQRLAPLRAELRRRLRASPLLDQTSYAREVERLFRQTWKQWCTSRPGQS